MQILLLYYAKVNWSRHTHVIVAKVVYLIFVSNSRVIQSSKFLMMCFSKVWKQKKERH